jgi:hypothetical protein
VKWDTLKDELKIFNEIVHKEKDIGDSDVTEAGEDEFAVFKKANDRRQTMMV